MPTSDQEEIRRLRAAVRAQQRELAALQSRLDDQLALLARRERDLDAAWEQLRLIRRSPLWRWGAMARSAKAKLR